MALRTERDLSEPLRELWLKAVAAIELRNFGYAISLLQAVLREEPEFLTGRQLLRRAEVTQQKATKKKIFSLSTTPVTVMKAQREIKKDPRRAIELIEKILEDEPYNKQANVALKEAAVAAGWLEIGIFALQTVLEENASDTKILHELGRLYQALGDHEQQERVYQRIAELDPSDTEARRLGKDASARQSMKAGGWGMADSYRDLIKDKETARDLEQLNRTKLSGEALTKQLADALSRHQSDPANVNHLRQLAEVAEKQNDWKGAIGWWEKAEQIAADPEISRRISILRQQMTGEEIAALELKLGQPATDDREANGRRSQLEALRKRQAEAALHEARRRVQQNPADLQLRYHLGESLMRLGDYRAALPELQRARQHPHARLRAMGALGQAYRALGMFDLAARQLEEAAREIATMDTTKKEIVYELALVYGEMNDPARALACMKEIFEADYHFRDVAQRVESSYRQE